MKMENLEILAEDMIVKRENRATFTYEYNMKTFSCIFLLDVEPFRLYLTTLGLNPLVIEFEIDQSTYEISGYIDKYKELLSYLELKYDPNHKFMPKDFLKDLDNHIPHYFTIAPSYTDVIRIASHTRKVEECNKVYFCGWKKNPKSYNVSDFNYEKTRCAFGDEKAKMSKKKNISSCWTDISSDEIISRLNDINSL